jgi:hypothetical protein
VQEAAQPERDAHPAPLEGRLSQSAGPPPPAAPPAGCAAPVNSVMNCMRCRLPPCGLRDLLRERRPWGEAGR